MAIREAACSCGQLRLRAEGDPFHVGLCHCLACQRRTGSAFGMQAGFKAGQVTISGRHAECPRISDEADRKVHVFHFCRDCGGTVFYTEPDERDLVVVMVGAFAPDPGFPAADVVRVPRPQARVVRPLGLDRDGRPVGGVAPALRGWRLRGGRLPLRTAPTAGVGAIRRVSICHCLACQRRTGSAFGYPGPLSGRSRHGWTGPPQRVRQASGRRTGRSSGSVSARTAARRSSTFSTARPRPDRRCGRRVRRSRVPATDRRRVRIAAPLLARAAGGDRRDDVWEELLPLYEAGDYEAVADRGKQLVEAHPTYAELAYNVACCESLPGRADDAIAHLRLALEREESLRPQAAVDSDLDAIRTRAFRDLIG